MRWLRRRVPDRQEFAQEIDAHVALETDRLIDRGIEADEARRIALAGFGSRAATEERRHESTRVQWLDHLRQDLRAAMRSLSAYRTIATIAVLSLAGGIGSTTMMLVVRAVVFRNPPPLYQEAAQLSLVDVGRPDRERAPVPANVYTLWADDFAPGAIAAFRPSGSVDVRTSDQRGTVATHAVSPELFSLLGVAPVVGSVFSKQSVASEGGTPVVLSHRIWLSLFAGRADVIGQMLWIANHPHTVIGVMPERFWFDSLEPMIWMPLDVRTLPPDAGVGVVARRTAEMSPEGLQQRLQRVLVTHAAALPFNQREIRAQVWHVGGLPAGRQMSLAVPWLIGAAVFLTLLIAIANVAVLMIAQWTAREREISVRACLGAGRWRIVRLLLTESVLIALAGGALGIGATFLIRQFVVVNAGPVGPLFNFAVDPFILLWSIAVTLTAGLLAGVGPAILETRRLHGNPLRAITSERARQRWRHSLVIAEIAVTVALLVVVGTLIDGYREAFSANLGFASRGLIAVRLDRQVEVPVHQLLSRTATLPDVASVAAATAVPLAGRGVQQIVSNTAAGSNPVAADQVSIGEQFFDTLGVRLRAGRAFTTAEATSSARVVVINETLAKRLFGNADSVGRELWIDRAPHTTVGVVADYAMTMARRIRPGLYLPLANEASAGSVQLLIRAASNPAALAPQLRRDLGMMPDVAVTASYPIDDIRSIAGAETLSATVPFIPLVGMGLFLTAAGIYGVLSFALTRRAKDLAIRMAIGATRADLVRIVSAHSARLVGAGSALAVGVTFGLSRIVRALGGAGSFLDTPSWPAFAIPVLIVGVVGLLASWMPARRVLTFNPASLLRAE